MKNLSMNVWYDPISICLQNCFIAHVRPLCRNRARFLSKSLQKSPPRRGRAWPTRRRDESTVAALRTAPRPPKGAFSAVEQHAQRTHRAALCAQQRPERVLRTKAQARAARLTRYVRCVQPRLGPNDEQMGLEPPPRGQKVILGHAAAQRRPRWGAQSSMARTASCSSAR